MRVTIRGTAYETVREAAEAYGVSVTHVYNAISGGTQDSIGVGMGRWRKPRHRYDGNKIVLYGVTFESMKAASLALGFNQHYVRCATNRNSLAMLAKIKEAVEKYERKTEG